ncbi:HTH-type transcriptional activator IlvY [Oceanimonas sp. CHS3-5]|uniref:HTH-type transcriptional activator IlvY n=1 Tax=Oceanimonas sp. CHS3-5 TaxID=3068186 RepID=UPI00273D694C|nr:HTH-type transcriptional activator IlvY [Oceanimonas sp. CHS3-5]MDP5293823.1 HTH-type transcriptional activator IlvY [Oceanimonas sp. CHS3-5]
MELRNLELFVHLSQSLHFGRTADAMAVSPSTLSRAIQRLEQEVGCELLVRDNRSVALTPAGLRLQQFADGWLAEWQHLRDQLRHNDSPLQGRLRLFCSVTASYFLLPDILARFRTRYPQLELRLETGDPALAIDKVLNEETDLAIAARPDALPAKLEFIRLQTVPLVFIAPRIPCLANELLQQSPADWSRIPVILPEQGVARKRTNQWFRNKGISPNVYAEVAGNEAIVGMVALGCGVALVPTAVIRHSPMADKIQRLAVTPDLKPFEVGVCLLKKRLDDPLIRAFRQIALQQGNPESHD